MKPIYSTDADFADLRQRNCVYVDKTQYLHSLITDAGRKNFFISRPRRFGKSLMISTLKYIFQGRRDLFKGLYIDTHTDYDWKVYPVIHLDMSDINISSLEEFKQSLSINTRRFLKRAGLAVEASSMAASDVLGEGIEDLYDAHGRVVVLIDEYDAPISRTLGDPKLATAIRNELAIYYTKLKSKSPLIRFMLMTGITKFTKLSIFSSLNTPAELNMDPAYAAMLGYTDKELDANFSEHMHTRAEAMGLSYENYREELKRWYNGYRFSKSETRVYNPISIAQSLSSSSVRFEAPWTKTGRPGMLAWFLKTHDITALPFEKGLSVGTDSLETSSELNALDPVSMLYQTGYLTITEARPESDKITLNFPDEEVRRDMYQFLSDIRARREGWCQKRLADLEAGNVDAFLTGLTSLYDGLPYNARDGRLPESHYQGVLKGIMLGGGFVCHCEEHQANGHRSDMSVETENYIYIFELKVDTSLSANDAIAQIIERDYAAPHLGKGKPVFAVGLIFHPEDHTLRDSAWQAVTR